MSNFLQVTNQLEWLKLCLTHGSLSLGGKDPVITTGCLTSLSRSVTSLQSLTILNFYAHNTTSSSTEYLAFVNLKLLSLDKNSMVCLSKYPQIPFPSRIETIEVYCLTVDFRSLDHSLKDCDAVDCLLQNRSFPNLEEVIIPSRLFEVHGHYLPFQAPRFSAHRRKLAEKVKTLNQGRCSPAEGSNSGR